MLHSSGLPTCEGTLTLSIPSPLFSSHVVTNKRHNLPLTNILWSLSTCTTGAQPAVCSCEFTTLNLQEVSEVTKQPEAAKPTLPHSPADVTAVYLRDLTLEVKRRCEDHTGNRKTSVCWKTLHLAMMEGKLSVKAKRNLNIFRSPWSFSSVSYWSWTGTVFSVMGDKGRHMTAHVFCFVIIIPAVWDLASAFQ